MCRRTTDRWKYPLLFFSLLRMQFWRSHVWRATFPPGIPSSFNWTHCCRLSQLFYCYINVNLKILVLPSLHYLLPLFICIYKVSYVSLVNVELKFSYARLEEVWGQELGVLRMFNLDTSMSVIFTSRSLYAQGYSPRNPFNRRLLVPYGFWRRHKYCFCWESILDTAQVQTLG